MTIKKNRNRPIQKIKNAINDEVILRYEVGILLTILVISVTIAWFTNNSEASITDAVMNTAELKPSLIISNGVDGVELGEDDSVSLVFHKDNQTKLMPGTEGTLTVYVTSEQADVTGCVIYLKELIPTYYDSDLSEDMDQELKKIIAEHILFYYPDETEKDSEYIHPITSEEGYHVKLTPGENKEVTIYWIWPYSYADIPQVLDPMNSDKSTNYDMEDSKIGGYVKNIAFQLNFEAIFKEAQ